jgi:3-deoxy-D-manno-octulosonate 8-phosphate phosphatase (KDO 8-P phosphatase)
MATETEIQRRARRIRLLLMDCDGVLTDGRIVLLPGGDEVKFFNSLDGQGLKLAAKAGLRTGIITIRRSRVLEQRAAEVAVNHLCQQVENKLDAYEMVIRKEEVADDEVAYVGDDLPDLPPMKRVGLAIAVANAVEEVKQAAHYVTKNSGGSGAVREAIEVVLKAQGKWAEIIASFSR